MKAKTQSEWLEYYAERTGTQELNLLPDELVFFHPEHGFVTYITYDDILEIDHMCGDGKYWVRFLKSIARLKGLKKFRMHTMRNPRAWERRYGMKLKSYCMEANVEDVKD